LVGAFGVILAGLIVLLVAGQASATDAPDESADRVSIPVPFQGHWALDKQYCDEPGAANVYVSPRRIDFYERHGFLDLGALNQATEIPAFHGLFRWVELLRFSSSSVRLEIVDKDLFITEGIDPEADRSKAAWSKCPAK
jgi:hypothetical protein